MKNSELLHARAGLLRGVDSQRRYVLSIAIAPRSCPACLGEITQISADSIAKGDVDAFDVDSVAHVYDCPLCAAPLVYYITMFGPPYFGIDRERATVTITIHTHNTGETK